MIESRYWKEDLLGYAKKFTPTNKPPRWSEKLAVNFEKDVIMACFMIRKLYESKKLSSLTEKHKVQVFSCQSTGSVNARNFWDIEELYDLEKETKVSKSIIFTCNQFIHGGAIYAYRKSDRNWGGVYTCSDFERKNYIYRLPITEIITMLKVVGNDYPYFIEVN